MSKFSFTSIFRISMCSALLFVLSFFPLQSQAQCSLACNGSTQVSLDNTCSATITPEMILNDAMTSCPDPAVGPPRNFVVTVEDEYNNYLTGYSLATPNQLAIVDESYKDQVLHVKVTETTSGNSCWGYLIVEDKIKPVMDCTQPVGPFYCYNLNTFNPSVTDNCDPNPTMTLLEDLLTVNDCSQSFIDELDDCGFFPDANGTTYAMATADHGLVAYVLKIHTRTYMATDNCGNESAPCQLKLIVEAVDDLATAIVCPESLLLSNGTNLLCDGDYELIQSGPNAGHPIPRGTFVSRFPITGVIETTDVMNAGGTEFVDSYMIEFNPATGTCENVTISTTNTTNGIIRVRDQNGTILIGGAGSVVVTLCEGQMYTVQRVVNISNPNIPVDYELSITANGTAGNYVPGVPYLTDGVAMIDLYPDPNLYCNLITSFSDVNLGSIGCVEKIMRTWTILEWSCGTSNDEECVQIIEIADNVGPSVTCPSDITISTNGNGYDDCVGTYVPEGINPVDNCCSDLTMDLSWGYDTNNDGTIDDPLGAITDYTGTPINLPVGEITMTYIVYDCCYNSNTCSYVVTVEDNTPPVAICDQYTVVSLSTDGFAHIYASVFDDGSYDDCHLVDMRVKRMDNGSNCGIVENTFEDHITVCCADIGTTLMIQFRVYDRYHSDHTTDLSHYNECMVEVEVQDKIAPSIVCPDDITMNCDDPFDINGDLVAQFGDYEVFDNCGYTVTDEITTESLNQCNVGFITRRIRATDDGGRSTTCTQRIYFENYHPFYVDPANVCNSPNDDVVWPADVEFEGCDDPESSEFHPDNTGWPLISEDQCDLVGVNWDDQVFPFNSAGQNSTNVCFKIIRTWSIIDWCQSNSQATYEWSCTQIIKVYDPEGPTITSSCAPKSTCSFEQDCNDGYIELTATATDDCTTVLDWWADVDINSNGSFDLNYATFGTGGLADASGGYPVGTHTIYWSFKDKCGNVATCSQEFTVISCKAPTPYCLNGLSTDLMPVDTDNDGDADNGMIEIWANDFDNGSYHSCGYDVVLSFSSDITDTGVTFTCADFGSNTVNIYVTAVNGSGIPYTQPDGSLIQAFCTTFIDIQDNMNVCPGGGGGGAGLTARISGNVATENDIALEDTQIYLGDGVTMEMTDTDGMYAFADMPNGGAYNIEPANSTDPMNGVSTLDLVLIQKHLLQFSQLSTPYKHIAADVNKDNNISSVDLIELRKLILGINTDFQTNNSWRFVDMNYTFINPTDPLDEAFTETYVIPSLTNDMTIDFIAVKVGDVNNSVVANLNENVVSSRTDANFGMYTENTSFAKGDIVSVPFKATKNDALIGYQFTLDFNTDIIEYQGFNSELIELTSSNFGFQSVANGQISTSWNNTTSTEIQSNETLFTLEFVAKADGNLADLISITSQITNAEAYNVNNELMDISLQVRSDNNGFALYQNTPNPFSVSTDIAFEIPSSQDVKITIFDVTGKLITTIQRTFESGYNTVTIDKEILNTTGVLYYSLEADKYTATKKMVVLK